MEYLKAAAFLIVGLIIGSFLNVIIYRTPRKISIIKPGSHCLNCQNKIKWYDNIPIIGYLLLKGKCRTCGQKISIRYPLVEGLTGILFAGAYLKFGFTVEFLLALIFLAVGIVIIFIDLDFQIIPNLTVIIILILGIAKVLLVYFTEGRSAIDYYLLGFIVGFGVLFVIRLLGQLVFKQEAMGWGDIKLMTVAGLFLGVGNIILTILFSSIIAAVIELTLLKTGKRKKGDLIPFGPYLIIAMIITLFFGSEIINWYLNLLS